MNGQLAVKLEKFRKEFGGAGLNAERGGLLLPREAQVQRQTTSERDAAIPVFDSAGPGKRL